MTVHPSHRAAARRNLPGRVFFLAALAVVLAAGCQPQATQAELAIHIQVDGQTLSASLGAGSTVQQALAAAGVTLSDQDRVTPPPYSLLEDGDTIQVTRVTETFETRQEIIPFEHQELRNESLPEGDTLLLQEGRNGLKEITIRTVFEDGVNVGSSILREVVLEPSQPEIVMVGVQAAFAPLTIPGRLVYLSGGNAWLMEESTANRRPLVASGDLDGRVLALSPNGNWLLFSRKSKLDAASEINTLWVVSAETGIHNPIDLRISNVIHFAAWAPGEGNMVAYSTVEPRPAAPGWQANNDLLTVTFSRWSGPAAPREILEPNSGGVYGWWGTNYAFSPGGSYLAYARPDGIGMVDLEEAALQPLLEITPLQTRSDWAWIPGLAWGADSKTLYIVTHAAATGLVSAEESPNFDLSALSLVNGANVQLAPLAGMFAYPSVSALELQGAEKNYQVAYLQAVFPGQSETSRYRLVTIDRDGSNATILFPAEGSTGLEPQAVQWAPEALASGEQLIALVYQGNLWLVDAFTGQSYQITGDGLTTRLDWK